MAGTPESIAANQAALAAAAAAFRAVMMAGVEGAILAADPVGEETVGVIQDLISIQGPPRSAPGEPPHMETGDLYDSIDHEVEQDGDSIILTVASTADYSGFLEFGTSKMDARPFFRPALEVMVSGGRLTAIVRYSVASAQSAALAGLGGSG